MIRARLIALVLFAALATAGAAAAAPPSLWDGSRTVPLHRFPIFDEAGHVIVPTLKDAMPLSTRNTCGTCHGYATISGGFHFNASSPTAKPGRPGEPWVWVDRLTGTALPISPRGWEGTWKPAQIGVTPWRFTQLFGRNLPGGDLAQPADLAADAQARWVVSGPIEIDCFVCHNQSPEQDLSERARQMERENFRWAATAASGLGEVGGMASRLPGQWDVNAGIDPDDRDYAVPPTVVYDQSKYDASGSFTFEVNRPLDRNCLACHSTAAIDTPRWNHSNDVHTAAGLKCVDCHRNGLDHQIVRGYAGEAAERNDLAVAQFSCAGCHLGEGPGARLSSQGGKYAAPRPEHKGLPPVHFEKMTCTVCHSGALDEPGAKTVRTSRANRLGIHGRAVWSTDSPKIVETAYIKDASGKIEPAKLMWPSFFVKTKDGKSLPMTPDEAAPFAKGKLDAPEQVRAVLALLLQDPNLKGEPLFGAQGKFFGIDPDDQLRVSDATTTEPLTGARWRQKIGKHAEAILPDFDPAPEQIDPEAELELRDLLQVLMTWKDDGGQPVVLYKGKIFTRTFSGMLAKEDATTGTLAGDGLFLGWRARDASGTTRTAALIPELVAQGVGQTVGTDASFDESQIAAVLAAMQLSDPSAKFGYASSGKLFRLAAADATKLEASDDPIAAPYAWPLSHDVRPARQALGAKGCADCHSPDAPFYFSTLTGAGPLKTERAAVLPMSRLGGLDENYEKLFARSFAVRQTFKLVATAALGLLAAILLVFALGGVGRLARWLGGRG